MDCNLSEKDFVELAFLFGFLAGATITTLVFVYVIFAA